jgi:hypothetical protein
MAASYLAFSLPVVIAAGCAAIYWPFHDVYTYRIDRVLGRVKEPDVAFRMLVALLVVTLALSVLYLAVASLRRAPPYARATAPVTLVVLIGVYLHIIWVLIVLPFSNVWEPAEWQRPDLLTAFQPCRGAVLWFMRYDKIIPFGRIDDLWLHFADPRHGGTQERAISVEMTWREGYAWLDTSEASSFLIRRDDPALRPCHRDWRTERVAPSTWHTLGVKW